MIAAERYGAGLPHAGSRPMTPEEVAIVSSRARRSTIELASLVAATSIAAIAGAWGVPGLLARTFPSQTSAPVGLAMSAILGVGVLGAIGCLVAGRRGWRIVCGSAASYLLVVATLDHLAPHLRSPHAWLTGSVAIALLGTGLGAMASAIHRRGRLWSRRRALRADVQDGIVDRYVGPPRTRTTDVTLRRLGLGGPASGPTPRRLELLPRSGLILRADGIVPHGVELAHIVDVAATPAHAFRTALPDSVVPHNPPPKLQLQRRSLSPDERAELSQHIDRLRQPSWWAATIASSSIAVIGVRVSSGASLEHLVDAPLAAWLGVTAFVGLSYLRRVREARQLERDRQLRWVVTVEDDSGSPRHPTPPKLEVLPISRLAWTENAAPAGWRVARL